MRSTTRHVAVLAAAAAVVAAGAALATGGPGRRPAAVPQWESVRYPLDCGDAGLVVEWSEEHVDLTGDGRPEAVREVRCDAGAGSPPSAVYVFTADAAGQPDLWATLVEPSEGLLVGEVEVARDGSSVSVLADAYSGPSVPRCCPDTHHHLTWTVRDGRLVRT